MKKYIIVFVSFLLISSLLYYIGKMYSPGSYGNAETFSFNIDEQHLIQITKEFKDRNPHFKVPSHIQLSDHKNNHWFVIYFYYPQENEIIYTWIRSSGKEKSTLALVSVIDGEMVEKWKDINKDLSRSES